MAARKRRRKTRSVTRLIALGLANLVALALLWQLVGGAGASDVEARADEPATFARDPEPEPSWLEGEDGDALERDLRGIVARWIERARARTKNRVHSDNVTVAVHVRELGGGPRAEVGFGQHASLRPASNMKLVTTAAALVLLGPGWHFETPFEAGGPLVDGVLEGDLIVRAAGDPLYDPEAGGAVDHLLDPLVGALRARGLRAIAGDVVLDERSFPAPGPGPEWPDASQHWTEYCALAAGFSANRGALTAVVEAGTVGRAARVRVLPRDHGLPENFGVRTEQSGRLNVRMHARTSGVLVKGSVPSSVSSWSESMSHPDPVSLFGHALTGAFSRAGVLVEGRLRRGRDAPRGTLLASLRSPLLALMAPINTDSTNSVADQVFLATGYAVCGEGTRAASARATARALAQLGVSSEGLVQVDGSGLSRANRVTAAQMTALIEAVLAGDERSARTYLDSLALAGESGTLEKRMRDGRAHGRVRAKTGFIDGTSALSGVAHGVDGRSFVFSVLVNYPSISGLNSGCWKPMQDEICARLVEAAP
jgi:D-alanyl-D-alanine carboxypeptidase/D-alanyl-D-alanine-endopeptidase (penicillin-binding protein 4)